MKTFKDQWENGCLFNYWGEFVSSEHERQFQEHSFQANISRIQVLLLLASIAYMCGIIVDYLDSSGFTRDFWIMATFRAMVFVTGLSLRFYASSPGKTVEMTCPITAFMILIGLSEAVSVVLDSGRGLFESGAPFIVVIVLLFYFSFPPRLVSAVIGGSVSSLMYALLTITMSKEGAAHIITVIIFLVVSNVFGYLGFINSAQARRNRYIALEEERALNRQLQIEIAERKKVEAKLTELATIDELTNVPNRRHFNVLAAAEMNRYKRNGKVFCVLMIDIDHFKVINDNYGHDVGDMVLIRFVETCRNNLRVNDVIGRMGGEEFIVLLPETDFAQAMIIAERIRQAVEDDSLQTRDGNANITISVGVATSSDVTFNMELLLKKADVALYRAKRMGRNTVCSAFEGEETPGSEQLSCME